MRNGQVLNVGYAVVIRSLSCCNQRFECKRRHRQLFIKLEDSLEKYEASSYGVPAEISLKASQLLNNCY